MKIQRILQMKHRTLSTIKNWGAITLEVNLIPLNDQEAHYLGVPKLEQIVLKQLLLIEEAQAGVGVTYLLCHLWK